MNTSILRLVIAGLVITLAGLLGAVYLRQRQGAVRQLEATLRDELAANRRLRQAWRLEQAKATAVAQPANPAPAPDAARPAPPSTNLARGSRLVEELQSLPEYAPFQQRNLRRMTLRRYGELFAELKLTKDREERLKLIFDERQRDGVKIPGASPGAFTETIPSPTVLCATPDNSLPRPVVQHTPRSHFRCRAAPPC